MKNKSWKLIVTKQEYSTDINEEYEYSHEKAEHVSLPHKNAPKHIDAPSKVLKM